MKKTIFYLILFPLFVTNKDLKEFGSHEKISPFYEEPDEEDLCLIKYSVWHKIEEITSQYTSEQLKQLKNVDLKIGHITYKRKKGCGGYTNHCIKGKFQYQHVFCGNKKCRLDNFKYGRFIHNVPGQDPNIAYQFQELRFECPIFMRFSKYSNEKGINSFYCTLKGIKRTEFDLCTENLCSVPIDSKFSTEYSTMAEYDCAMYDKRSNLAMGKCTIELSNSIFILVNGYPERKLMFYCNSNRKSVPKKFDVRRNRCFFDKRVHNLVETVNINTTDSYIVKCSAYAFSRYEKLFCDIDNYTKLFFWGIPKNLTEKKDGSAINGSSMSEKSNLLSMDELINDSLDKRTLRAKNKYKNIYKIGYDDSNNSVEKLCKFLDCDSVNNNNGVSCKESFCDINEGYHIEFYGKIFYSFKFLCQKDGIPFVTRENECKAKIGSLDKLQIISNKSCYKDSNSEYLSIKKSCVVRGAEGYQITGIKGVDQKIVCLTDTAYKPEIVSVKIQYCDLPEIINGIYLDDCKTTKKGFKCYYICSHDDYLGLKFSGYIECKDNPKMEGTIAFTSNPTCSENKLTNDIWLFCFMAGIFVLFDWIIMMFYVHDEK